MDETEKLPERQPEDAHDRGEEEEYEHTADVDDEGDEDDDFDDDDPVMTLIAMVRQLDSRLEAMQDEIQQMRADLSEIAGYIEDLEIEYEDDDGDDD